MNKKILVLMGLLLLGTLLITGCATTGSYSYEYDERQQAPVGGGCGVTAPLSEESSPNLVVNEPVF